MESCTVSLSRILLPLIRLNTAIIPQVYLHYDPKTLKELKGEKRLSRQRMDFLLIFSNNERVVIEVDGKQHYSEEDLASPKKYTEMVAEDRKLRLSGYEVYRFSGYELVNKAGKEEVQNFFNKLLSKHDIQCDHRSAIAAS